MKRIRLAALASATKARPPGYIDAALAAGYVEAGVLWLEDAAYAALRARFSPGAPPVAAPVGAARFAVCKSCESSRDQGFGCIHHKSCCFGAWRSRPESVCPEGKW